MPWSCCRRFGVWRCAHGYQGRIHALTVAVARRALTVAVISVKIHVLVRSEQLPLQRISLPPSAADKSRCTAVLLRRTGEVAACVADVAIVEACLTPEALQRHTPDVAAARIVAVDANLPEASLRHACRAAKAAGTQLKQCIMHNLLPFLAPQYRF